MNTFKILIVILFVALSGCKGKQTIPNGKYVAGNESIIIKSKKIIFHINLVGSPPNKFWNKELDYTLRANGEIIPHTMTSIEYSKTLIHYDFKWDGKSIIKTTRGKGDSLKFSVKPELDKK